MDIIAKFKRSLINKLTERMVIDSEERVKVLLHSIREATASAALSDYDSGKELHEMIIAGLDDIIQENTPPERNDAQNRRAFRRHFGDSY